MPSMKMISLGAVAAFVLMSPMTEGQVFDAGYTFTYHFDMLPSFQTMVIIPETGLSLEPLNVPVTATIAWEIFDSLATGVPVHSGIWHPGDVPYAGLFDQTWLDGEGTFRITILSGSQLIQGFDIYVARYDAGTRMYTVYSDFIQPAPVPEPASYALAVFGAGILAVWRRHRR